MSSLVSLCNPVAFQPSFYVLGAGNLIDRSVNGITATANSISYGTDEFLQTNSAISFNGTSSRFTYANTLDKMKTTFSLSFFIKCNVLDIFQRPFNSDARTASGTTPWVRTSVTSGNLWYFGVGSNNTNISVSGGTVDTNWHHFAATCKGNGTNSAISLYIDGILIGSNSGGHANINVNKYMSFGVLWYNTSTYLDYLNGLMSDLTIFPFELTPGEISILNNQRGRLIY